MTATKINGKWELSKNDNKLIEMARKAGQQYVDLYTATFDKKATEMSIDCGNIVAENGKQYSLSRTCATIELR